MMVSLQSKLSIQQKETFYGLDVIGEDFELDCPSQKEQKDRIISTLAKFHNILGEGTIPIGAKLITGKQEKWTVVGVELSEVNLTITYIVKQEH